MTPSSLRRRIVGGITLATFLSVAALTTTLLVLLHARIHDQVDRMLLQLAQQDAADVMHEEEQGIHVHESPLAVPAVNGVIAEKYALILDAECQVVVHTENVVVTEIDVAACAARAEPGSHSFHTVTGLADELLHVVSLASLGPDGRHYTFIVGIRHADVDNAVWETTLTAIPLALLAVLLIVVTAWLSLRRPVAELGAVTEVCATLEASTPQGLADGQRLFGQLAATSSETLQLRETLRGLLGRVDTLMRRQEQFIAEASHELRTPLTALRGEIEVTLRRERSADEYREALTWAQADVERLIGLAEQLLSAARSRHQHLALEPVALAALVEEVVEMHHGELESRALAVAIHISADVIVVTNRVALGQILSNLVSNTIQHADASQLVISVEAADGLAVVELADNGKGIPEEQVEGLFEPFHHDVRSDGHGLGLYIASDLTTRLGTTLRYVGDTRGARWRWSLPLAP